MHDNISLPPQTHVHALKCTVTLLGLVFYMQAIYQTAY